MKTDEVKTKKRIKRVYPRLEVIHRFFHSDERLKSTNRGCHAINAVGNYLISNEMDLNVTENGVKQFWYSYKTKTKAIIDRKNKKVILFNNYIHFNEVHTSIPKDYEVFISDNEFKNSNILNDEDWCLKQYCIYLAKNIIRNYTNSFRILYGLAKNCYYSDEESYYAITLKNLVDKYKINKKDWYDKIINVYDFIPIRYDFHIKVPICVKDLYNNNLFTESQKETLRQHHFYTKYCYGNGISLRDVKDNWNKPLEYYSFVAFIDKTGIGDYRPVVTDCKTWNDAIIKYWQADKDYIERRERNNNELSKENYQKALEEFNKINNKFNVNGWREYKTIVNKRIYYQSYTPSRNRKYVGTWSQRSLLVDYKKFDNIQLRLTKDKQNIETSRSARVPLNKAIFMFKLIMLCIESGKGFDTLIGKRVGLYTINYIKYVNKVPDVYQRSSTGERTNLNSCKQWLIQISCHNIWLDDVIDFIHYYHLEEEFEYNKFNLSKYKK